MTSGTTCCICSGVSPHCAAGVSRKARKQTFGTKVSLTSVVIRVDLPTPSGPAAPGSGDEAGDTAPAQRKRTVADQQDTDISAHSRPTALVAAGGLHQTLG